MRADQWEDILLDISRMQREAIERIHMKMASQQLGEAWITEDRREVTKIKRGPQRRKWKQGDAIDSNSHEGPRPQAPSGGSERHRESVV